ncbi:dihydroneopterin aldolase [Niallia taxi]|uniref:7,8-dihydroneopterin aldolase n=1 Tax=Niallia taxi TaxID=2499688 RepID=A0A437K357_9BACI|nr:dihydroneopterin aldolase [Niallia taxi]MCM3218075.1 dihydroneopterin aldolase [Niallia taxi]MDK8643275.1 dihydroneopterin aldolase [Niallia taxi]MED4040131.1 dihydroneopterin aldolase [Niallia taxi]MED4056167.1 dihydroneopterin aldolase [Niallia taxi]MED4120609.1 dihydroneopterin aldolase [Niallia taxi]
MDKIALNKMEFYGYHGVFQEETKLGQRFIIDLEVEADLQQAGTTDNLEYSINYGQLYFDVKEIVEGEPLKLIEAVAEAIAKKMLNSYNRIQSVMVRVIKPDPPIPGHYQSVSVEILRKR